MESLLKDKQYDKLDSWIKSGNIDVQAYALEGYYRAALQGHVLPSDKIHLMDSLIRTQVVFSQRSGCTSRNIRFKDIVSISALKKLQSTVFIGNEKRRHKEWLKRWPYDW